MGVSGTSSKRAVLNDLCADGIGIGALWGGVEEPAIGLVGSESLSDPR